MHTEQRPTAPHPKRRQPRLWLLVPLAALAFALAFGWVYKVRHANAQAARRPVRPPAPEVKLNDSLLMDSVLSIVQSYYVDNDRVDNRSLLATALKSLSVNPHLKAGLTANEAWLEVAGGDRKTFPVKDPLSYQEVLELLGNLGHELDRAGETLVAGEMPEKTAPGAVAVLNATLNELDAHSALLSPDAYKELRQGTEGAFGGLGVLVGIRDNLLTVIKPLPHSPAQRAGIKKHDRILGIDGKFTYGFALDDLVEYMRGDPGTEVRLSLLRDGAHAPQAMTLKREIIHVDSVSVNEIDRGGLKVLHLTIENFASRTSREVLNAIKKFKLKTGGILHGLVLDLRSNPGGLLDQAVQVADLFLQSGVIVTTKGRREEVETAGSGFDEVGFPIAVLIDGDSASASEIVAGALQDHQRAVVIGQPSFGKGSVQTIFELPGERALKLTIARYYTPLGRSIQNVGIVPDIWLQPMAKLGVNDNLFGPYRYKNERFLRNHLEVSAEKGAGELGVSAPSRKAYYLVDPVKDDGAEEPPRPDRELDLALQMFTKVHSVYGDTLPNSAARASHWLALAGPQLAESAERLDRAARAWVKEAFGVSWLPPTKPVMGADVELKLAAETPRSVATGGTLNVAFTLVNHESFAVERASVFIRTDTPGLDTKEILVGTVPAGGTRSGHIGLTLPSHLDPQALLLRVGAAVDAWPTRRPAADYLVQVVERPVSDLTANVELTSEVGGSVTGFLEGRERAKLRVNLSNASNVAARDLTVKIVNLSGTQLQILTPDVAVGLLPSGGKTQVFVDIQGARTLYSPELGVGLSVESPDLRVPVRQRFVIKGWPNADVSKASSVSSH